MAKPRGKGFAKGQSGNPGGRPKIAAELKELCRTYTEQAIKAIVAVLTNEEARDADKLTAATALLDRGYGKPTQHVQAEVSVFERMGLDDRYALESAIAAIVGGLGNAEGGEPKTHH